MGFEEWYLAAVTWTMVALAGSIVVALKRWPGDWAAARLADDLGLEERVTSALYAAETGHLVSHLLADEAQRGLARLVPSDYPLIPHSRRWLPLLLAAVILSIAVTVPLPILGEGGLQAAEAGAVMATRKSVEELKIKVNQSPIADPLTQKTEAELEAVEKQLAEARSAADAAKALEKSQERLASLAQQEHYAWERALEGLADSWGENPDLGALARALADRDVKATEKALAELSAREEKMAPAERHRLQVALQTGANAARGVTSLASAMRQAASRMGADSDRSARSDGTQEALDSLASTLAEGVGHSIGLQTAQKAMAGLGRARATLGPIPGGAANAAAGRGTAGDSASDAPLAGGSATNPAGNAGSDKDGDIGSGNRGGSGTDGGNNSANRSGGGTGSGSGSGASSGAGGSGGGTGAGAGAGGGPTIGKPGAERAGATLAGGQGVPSERSPTRYERIYATSLVGGDDGARVQAQGDAAGASGDTVEIPESQVSLGSLRPYNEVYGEYESAARESASRKQLPPALLNLVQRYFSSIKPED